MQTSTSAVLHDGWKQSEFLLTCVLVFVFFRSQRGADRQAEGIHDPGELVDIQQKFYWWLDIFTNGKMVYQCKDVNSFRIGYYFSLTLGSNALQSTVSWRYKLICSLIHIIKKYKNACSVGAYTRYNNNCVFYSTDRGSPQQTQRW